MSNKNLKNVDTKLVDGKLIITIDMQDITEDPMAVLGYEKSSTGASYTIAQIGSNFGGERLFEGQPFSIKMSVYAGKKDVEGLENLAKQRKMAQEAAELKRLKEELQSDDYQEYLAFKKMKEEEAAKKAKAGK